MINKIIDFLYDPFGSKKKAEDARLDAMIKRLQAKSKMVDDALFNRDYDRAERIIESMKGESDR